MTDPSEAFETALREARDHQSRWIRRQLDELNEAALGRPLSAVEEDRARAYRAVLAEREESTR